MEPCENLADLIAEAKKGDRKAFNGLVESSTEHMETYFRLQLGKRLRRKVEIEDLVQEAFLRAFKSIGRFRGEDAESFRSWLIVIADHVIFDQARRLHARGATRGEVSLDQKYPARDGGSFCLENALAARDNSPSQAMRRDERFDRLKRVLGSLSPDHSRVIFLARVQGLPIKEVARRMERTPEATSMLLFRALLKLKAAFGNTESLNLPDRSLEQEGDGDVE